MAEKQEIPSSEAESTSSNLIKDVPNVKDAKENLLALREQHGYSPDGIWSDSRLETAAQGMAIYVDVHNNASELLKKYLDNVIVIQAFTGVRPVLSLGHEDPKILSVESNFYNNGVKDLLFPQIREEFQNLLEIHSKGSIRLVKIDYRKVKYVNEFKYELMNVSAIQNIANENPDLFPQDSNMSPIDWLTQNPDVWPMTPQSFGEEAKIKEIRCGVLSGFPRSASEKYSEEAASNIDWKKEIRQLVFGPRGGVARHKIEHKPYENEEVINTMSASGLPYKHYSEEDLKWTKESLALLNHSLELFGLPKSQE